MVRSKLLPLVVLSGLSLAVLQVAAGPTFLSSCAAPGYSWNGTIQLGPVKLSINVTAPPPPPGFNKFDVSANPGQGLNDGDCVEITGLDSHGNPTGFKVTTPVPATILVPTNNVGAIAKKVPCPEPPPHGAQSSGSFQLDSTVRVWGVPILTADQPNGPFDDAWYDFTVHTTNGQNPESVLLPVLAGGPGTAVPSGVTLHSLTQVRETTSGLILVVSDLSHITTLQVTLNGNSNYANLATGTNVTQYDLANGWNVVEVFIATADLNLLSGGVNTISITRASNTNPIATQPIEIDMN
jgi:hypothetical protein